MSVERPTPQVVAFDGLHRSGKGTQAFLLHRGVFDISEDVSIHDLYPGNSSLDSGSRVDLKKRYPVFYLILVLKTQKFYSIDSIKMILNTNLGHATSKVALMQRSLQLIYYQRTCRK